MRVSHAQRGITAHSCTITHSDVTKESNWWRGLVLVFPFPTTRQKFALCLGWVKVSVQSHEGAAALARRGTLGGACSSLGCPLAQLPGLCPSQKPVPSHHFPKQKLSRSSAARFERVKHAFVCSLVILNSWVRAAHSPRPWMAILTLKRKSSFWLAEPAVWWHSFPAT